MLSLQLSTLLRYAQLVYLLSEGLTVELCRGTDEVVAYNLHKTLDLAGPGIPIGAEGPTEPRTTNG